MSDQPHHPTESSPVHLSGLIPIMATPFTDAGALDRPSLARLTEFQVEAGADGLAVFGMASEGFSLTTAEKQQILRDTRGHCPADLPLVAGVNATSTATAIEQALAARDDGADALMVLPPFLAKPSPAQVVDFYGRVAEASGLHVMVQDAPASTGVSMPIPLLIELSKAPGVESVKIETQPTAPKVAALVDATLGNWTVFGGQNALFVLEEYAGGSVGTMPACEFTDVLQTILQTYARGDVLDAHRAFNQLLPLIRFGLQPGIAHAVHKHVLVRRGIISTATVRDPVSPMSSSSLTALELILEMDPLTAWKPGS